MTDFLWVPGHFYVFVRTDLPAAQQTVQAIHAAYEAGIKFGIDNSLIDSVVVCSANSEEELNKIGSKLRRHDIPLVEFREPDIGNQLTAFATGPLQKHQRKRLSSYKMWRAP